MKTKVLFAAVAVAFSFAVTSCGNKKAADANAAGADSCCADKYTKNNPVFQNEEEEK